jgi:phage baseplate assembly protein W
MAFNERKISPLDLGSPKNIGIDLPLNGEGVFKPNFTTKDALKTDLINFLLTNPGERYLNPTFGAGLQDFIFSQLEDGNLDFLREDLSSKINRFFPNINLETLEILSNGENSISIKMLYKIINTNITDEINISF